MIKRAWVPVVVVIFTVVAVLCLILSGPEPASDSRCRTEEADYVGHGGVGVGSSSVVTIATRQELGATQKVGRDLFGVVLDGEGSGIPGASVRVVVRAYDGEAMSDRDDVETLTEMAGATKSDGSFYIEVGAATEVDVSVVATGFATEHVLGWDPAVALPVRLSREARLVVYCVDVDGNLVEDAEIRVFQRVWEAPLTTDVTDSNGRAVMAGLPHGQVYVDAWHSDLGHGGPAEVLLDEGVVAEKWLGMPPASIVRGRVFDQDTGLGLAGAVVGIGEELNNAVVSDDGGGFAIRGFSGSGIYDIRAKIDGYSCGADLVRDKDHVSIRMTRGHELRGRLVGHDGEVASGAYVRVLSTRRVGRRIDIREQHAIRSDGHGIFLVADLWSFGNHEVRIRHGRLGHASIALTGCEPSGVIDLGEIELTKPVSVRGTVVNGDGEALELSGASVGLLARDHPRGAAVDMRRQFLGKGGQFAFTDVLPGNYSLVLGGSGMACKAIDIDVGESDLHLEVMAPSRKLVVAVHTARGQPVAGMDVFAVPTQGRGGGASVTGDDGRCEILVSSGETYTVAANTPDGWRAASAVAKEGDRTVLLVARPVASIQGWVVGPSGAQGIGGVQVKWTDEIDSISVTTDDSGHFFIEAPAGARGRLVVEDSSYEGIIENVVSPAYSMYLRVSHRETVRQRRD